MRWTIAILFCSLAACHHPAYILSRQGRSQILTPPSTRPVVKNARAHPSQKSGCDVASGSFSLTWRGNTARVAAKPETYYAPPESAAAGITETGPRMFADTLADLEKFRQALAANEGCLRSAEAARLEQTITETFAFPPQIVAYLRFGAYAQTGSFDLTPEFLLRLVSPAGSAPDISLYAITAVAGDDRVRIAQISGAGKSLTVPETAAYFRYLYWTGASAHNFRSTILGAPDRPALQSATRHFLDDPDRYCAKPEAGVFCQSIAASVGMNAGFYVRINTREVFVRIGGTVGEAIEETSARQFVPGRARTPPPISAVRRMFHGKLIPIKFEGNEILSLVLMPGDEIVTSVQ